MSSPGLYDPTEVMNGNEMARCQKEGWIKLAFFLISFFYYLYRWEISVVSYGRSRGGSMGSVETPFLSQIHPESPGNGVSDVPDLKIFPRTP